MRNSLMLLVFTVLLLLPDGRVLWRKGWYKEFWVMGAIALLAWLVASGIMLNLAQPVVDAFFSLLPEVD